MINVSRCMSTQHPDNITTPFFSDSEVLSGNTEVKEAYYVFSQLGCKEQMWDNEGKDVDNQVVEKLLSTYIDFFSKQKLGKDLFLTYRVPNPSVQKNKGKVLLEVLHSIPRAYDAAKEVNGNIAPIFEVILPMTKSSLELNRIYNYYQKVVIGQQDTALTGKDAKIKEWIGDFHPENINVIPLFEDFDAFEAAPKIVEEYAKDKKLEYLRVFLARSDPALNYGSVSAVLMAKLGLYRLSKLEEKLSIPILPILGVGSPPFRGNLKPTNTDNCTSEYPSVQTFTIQSSFKYDYPFRDVVNAIDMLTHIHRAPALPIEEEKALHYFHKIKEEYQKQLLDLYDVINAVSKSVPSRRARRLHVGLFGYSRSSGGVSLPRAIPFCAALYSLGLPPELLGLSSLSEKEFDDLHSIYLNMDSDLSDAMQFFDKKSLEFVSPRMKKELEKVIEWLEFEENPEYCEITHRILKNVKAGNIAVLREDIEQAAFMRKFLG